MNSISDELIQNSDAIVQRWYESWRDSEHTRKGVSETALKDRLSVQLRNIGEQLKLQPHAEKPNEIWHVSERLDPEKRVEQDVEIEEVVQEYWLAICKVREWIEERDIEVDAGEYSYFYEAVYALVAESVRRYASYQAERVKQDRAHHLASVMHQLRTPLSALSLQVELLSQSGHGTDTELAEKLKRNVRRMSVLVDGILRLERFRPGEVDIHPQEFQLEQLVMDVMDDYRMDAAKGKLQFEAHIDRSLSIVTDPDLFVDALGNLIQNAVKYAKQGFVVVDTETDPNNITIHVRDSGPGIPPDQQSNLFQCTQPGRKGGAGIGLQIAQHAAQAQGGSIEVQSELGKGSIFSLHIPRNVAQSAAHSDTPH